jgi:hypothetical protein
MGNRQQQIPATLMWYWTITAALLLLLILRPRTVARLSVKSGRRNIVAILIRTAIQAVGLLKEPVPATMKAGIVCGM